MEDVGGAVGLSVTLTFLCRFARCLLRFEVEFFVVDESFNESNFYYRLAVVANNSLSTLFSGCTLQIVLKLKLL